MIQKEPIKSTLQYKINEIQEQGYCILKNHFSHDDINACRNNFWPTLNQYLKQHGNKCNRGTNRHFLPMPFNPPCFTPNFFFNDEVLTIAKHVMDDRIVADQWGCDVPVKGSEYQGIHVDYQRPLFNEIPNLLLPVYMLVVNFGLVKITGENGPIEIAPCTHRMPGKEAFEAIEAGEIKLRPIHLDMGDVLIRHPWALHRGTPNITDVPRVLLTIRYVRNWYYDASRDVSSIPNAVWNILNLEQKKIMRFPIADSIISKI